MGFSTVEEEFNGEPIAIAGFFIPPNFRLTPPNVGVAQKSVKKQWPIEECKK